MASLAKTLPKLRQLQRELAVWENAVANIPRYKAQIEGMRERLSNQKKKLSTKQEISSLLKRLSEIAKDSGVKILSIKPHPAVAGQQQDMASGTYQKYPISIKAVCGYHQLGIFLNKLENADTFMRVSNIKITANPENFTQHFIYILVNTYILNET
jgi:Tfp pilus assembly protein PilO